jgi:cytochrome c oxidase subunit 2
MKRDIAGLTLLWLVLSGAGLALLWSVEILPEPGSESGEEIASAFRVLTLLSVPVFALVVAVLGYALARSSSFRMPEEDGPPIEGRGFAPAAWLVVTSVLAGVTMVVGLAALPKVMAHEHHPDVRVKLDGVQWTWLVSYPDDNVTSREIVIPVDRIVNFEITSNDVLHSFWIPGLAAKIDAVPGITTEVSLRATRVDSYATNPMLRAQCAELCGLSHARMWVPVRVVTQEEFEAWLAEEATAPPAPAGTPAAGAQHIAIVAKNVRFDLDTITIRADAPVHLTVDNQDGGVTHNWALYENEDAAEGGEDAIASTPLENGPLVQELTFTAPVEGTYFYRCDVHPTTMTGTLVAE